MTDLETQLRLMAVDDELSDPRKDAAAWAVGEIDRLRTERDEARDRYSTTIRAMAAEAGCEARESAVLLAFINALMSKREVVALRAQLEAAKEIERNVQKVREAERKRAERAEAENATLRAQLDAARVKGGDDEPPGALDAI